MSAAFLAEVTKAYRAHKRAAEAAMAQVADDRFFTLLDDESNSLALLVKHIAGNLRSRFTGFLTSDGEKPDRHRDNEFLILPGDTHESLMQRWEESWGILFATLDSLTPADFDRTITIRSEPHTILQALNRSLNHMVAHIGQIVFLAKHLRSAEWQTLSVPRGKTEEFNAKMAAKFAASTSSASPAEGETK